MLMVTLLSLKAYNYINHWCVTNHYINLYASDGVATEKNIWRVHR